MKALIILLLLISCTKSYNDVAAEKFLQVTLSIASAGKNLNIEIIRYDSTNKEQEKYVFIVAQQSGEFEWIEKTDMLYLEHLPTKGYYRISYLNDEGEIEFYSKYFLIRSLPVIIEGVRFSWYYKNK